MTMRKKRESRPLLPLPDPEGIRKTRQPYKEKFGRDITDEEAMDILGRVMRFIYLTSSAANPPEKSKEDQ